MTNKEFIKRINAIKNNSVKEMFLSSFNRSSGYQKRKMRKMQEVYERKLCDDLNYRAKSIAAYVRCFMEDFHCKHLTDAQMKELNPIIRNAIYTFLKDYADGDFFGISGTCACNLASYWEDCEYLRK